MAWYLQLLLGLTGVLTIYGGLWGALRVWDGPTGLSRHARCLKNIERLERDLGITTVEQMMVADEFTVTEPGIVIQLPSYTSQLMLTDPLWADAMAADIDRLQKEHDASDTHH